MEMITDHFSLAELTHSEVGARIGIDNTPPAELVPVLADTARRLECVRTLLNSQPLLIHSGYRSFAVNALVGGVPDSAHRTGRAVDFVCPSYGSPFEIAQRIAASGIGFDQCILEYGWVHISFDPRMRRQVMTKKTAASPYMQGIVA